MRYKLLLYSFIIFMLSVCMISQVFAVPSWVLEYTSSPNITAETSFDKGFTSLTSGDMEGAEGAFKESLYLDPEYVPSMLGLAEVFFNKGKVKEAEAQLQKAIALEPMSSEVQTVWGRYLYSTGNFSEAEVAFKRAIDLDATAFLPLYDLGDIYLNELGKPDEAIRVYRAALGIEPHNFEGHYKLGKAFAVSGKIDEAKRELREAGRIEPDNPLPFYSLGQLYIENNESDKALDAYTMALKAEPDLFQAHMYRGDIFFFKGADEKALAEYSSVLKIEPKFALAQVKIGVVHERHKHEAEAESAYLIAIELDPTQVVAYNNLAWMAVERKSNLDKALTWAKKANDLVSHPEFKDTLGWVYRARGELDKAISILENAAFIWPQQVNILYHLGVVYAEKGMIKEAVKALNNALSLKNDFSGAEDARRLLRQLDLTSSNHDY